MMPTTFDVNFLCDIGVCYEGLDRVATFGGSIENTRAGWLAYVAAFPDAWCATVFTAWALKRNGWAIDQDLIWKIARVGIREAGKFCPSFAPYAETLGPNNWYDARYISFTAPGLGKNIYNVVTDCKNAYNDYFSNSCVAGDATRVVHYVLKVTADDTRAQVKAEILEMVIAALVAADPG